MLAPCKVGDSGSHVKALQIMLNSAGFSPGEIDGIYGPKTSAALLACRKSVGSRANSGDVFEENGYQQLHVAHVKKWSSEGAQGPPGPEGPAGPPGPAGARGPAGRLVIEGEVSLP